MAYEFLTVVLLTLGLGMIIAGGFTAYFGRGKSRNMGIALSVIGILFWALTIFLYSEGVFFEEGEFTTVFMEALTFVGGFVVGAIIAIAIFLVAIMKT